MIQHNFAFIRFYANSSCLLAVVQLFYVLHTITVTVNPPLIVFLFNIAQLIICSAGSEMDANGLSVIPDFVSEAQESHLITETSRAWRHTKYEYSHWDNVNQLIISSNHGK